MNVVLAAVHRIILKIRNEDLELNGGKAKKGKKGRARSTQILIRLKPNFLEDGKNFHSPPIPLYGNLAKADHFLSIMFEGIIAAVQSAQLHPTDREEAFQPLQAVRAC